MRMKGRILSMAVTAAVLAAGGTAQAAPPAYYPSGPQASVPRTALDGWTQCWNSTYESHEVDLTAVLDGCQGQYMLLAGGDAGAPTWDVLAAAPRADVLFDTHNSFADTTSTHPANGSDWYFNADWTWGFLKQGDPRHLFECDQDFTTNPQLRLCWHTGVGGAFPSNTLSYGYRAGTKVSWGPELERAIYVSDGGPDLPPPPPPPPPAPVLTDGTATGGGFVMQGAEKVHFSLDDGGCTVSVRKAKLRCGAVQRSFPDEKTAVLEGDGVRIEVVDNGEPGRNDRVSITTDGGLAVEGPLAGGNVQVVVRTLPPVPLG